MSVEKRNTTVENAHIIVTHYISFCFANHEVEEWFSHFEYSLLLATSKIKVKRTMSIQITLTHRSMYSTHM
jgi:hypothetical protein